MKHEAKVKFEEALRDQDIFWSQRMKSLWKTNRDKCIKIFHKVLNSYAMDGRISSLKIDGVTCSDTSLIKNHVVSFFKDLYTESNVSRHFFHELPVSCLCKNNSEALEADFTEEEIFTSFSSLAQDKTLGSDGLQIEVYRSCWHFIKLEILVVFKEFQEHGYIDWRLNTTFITLVPKVEGEK